MISIRLNMNINRFHWKNQYYIIYNKYDLECIIMSYFENKYGRREKVYRRSYYIDNILLTQLEDLSKIYRAKIPDFINDSVEELIRTENIEVYNKAEGELSIKYTVLVRKSNLKGLEDLNKRYGISLSKLVNIAIRNLLNSQKNLIANNP